MTMKDESVDDAPTSSAWVDPGKGDSLTAGGRRWLVGRRLHDLKQIRLIARRSTTVIIRLEVLGTPVLADKVDVLERLRADDFTEQHTVALLRADDGTQGLLVIPQC